MKWNDISKIQFMNRLFSTQLSDVEKLKMGSFGKTKTLFLKLYT